MLGKLSFPLLLLTLTFCSKPSLAAKGWSGDLVNSNCYESEERNINPTDTEGYVDRDRELEIRLCAPNEKTKFFAVVQADGTTFRLDSAGNFKAAELVRNVGKKRYFPVAVTGEMNKNTVKVDSISTVK